MSIPNNVLISFDHENVVKSGILDLSTNEITEIDSFFSKNIISEKYVSQDNVRLLAPVYPSKIIGVGLNYHDHAEEFGREAPAEPLIFMKAPTTILNPDAEIILPPQSERVDYEAELVIVIKERTKEITETQAKDHILGYTCGNDVTARDLQQKDDQWTRAKSFDTFAPIGPWIVPAEEIDPSALNIIARKNDEVVQYSNTDKMIFNPYFLVSYISHMMTLLPGDIIMTGTPKGIGPLSDADSIEIEIENIGVLKNYARLKR